MKFALPLLALLASPVHAAPEWTVRLVDTRENPVGRPDKDWSDPRRRATVKDLREAAITSFLYNELLKPKKITQATYTTARNIINATDYGAVVGVRAYTFRPIPLGDPDFVLQITYFDDAVRP